jgi:hypothetical protein
MAHCLPQEIVSLIAQHVAGENDKMAPYTVVSRSWQAAFEKQINTSLVVLSPSRVGSVTASPGEQHKKRGLSLERLDELTSGP